MAWVDYLVIGIILISASISIVRGFIKEVLSLVSWGLAFWVGLMFYAKMATLLTDYISTPSIRLFLAFFILFAITLILCALVNYLIGELVEKTGLSGTDRALGVIFGILRGVALVTILVLGAGATPMPEDDSWQKSLLLEHFEKLAIWLRDMLPTDIAQYINYN